MVIQARPWHTGIPCMCTIDKVADIYPNQEAINISVQGHSYGIFAKLPLGDLAP